MRTTIELYLLGKLIDVSIRYKKQFIVEKILKIQKMDFKNNAVDVLTKSLMELKFVELESRLFSATRKIKELY